MASAGTSSEYFQYKEDTSKFLAWLSDKAREAGWASKRTKDAPAASDQAKPVPGAFQAGDSRLKGKARKLAKAAATAESKIQESPQGGEKHRYMVTTREVLDQVECGVKAHITLPQQILRALRRAIRLRVKFSASFATCSHPTGTNDGHRHFISVLQIAEEKLLPFVDNVRLSSTDRAGQGSRSTEAPTLFRNEFEALELFETGDDDLLPREGPAQGTRFVEPQVSYNLEEDNEWEALVITAILMRDVDLLSQELNGIWSRYYSSNLDLATATILTAQGLALFETTEKVLHGRLLNVFAGNPANHGSWGDFVVIKQRLAHHGPRCPFDKSVNPDAPALPTISQTSTEPPSPLGISRAGNRLIEFAANAAQLPKQCICCYNITAVRPLFWHYLDGPGPASEIDNYFLTAGYEEDQHLCQMLLEMILWELVEKRSLPSLGLPVHPRRFNRDSWCSWTIDPIYAALQPVWKEAKVSTTAVVAASLLVDIHRMSRGSTSALLEIRRSWNPHPIQPGIMSILLQPRQNGASISLRHVLDEAAKHFQEAFAFLDDSALEKRRDRRRVNKKGTGISCALEVFVDDKTLKTIQRAMNGVLDFPRKSIFKDEISKSKRMTKEASTGREEDRSRRYHSYRENHIEACRIAGVDPDVDRFDQLQRSVHGRDITHSEEEDIIIENNPMYSSMLILDALTAKEAVGVKILNRSYFPVRVMAHMYNAIKQLDVRAGLAWPEMDELIRMFPGPLFANDIPETAKRMLQMYEYRTALNVPDFRAKMKRIDRMGAHFQQTHCGRSLQEFFESNDRLSHTLHSMQSQAFAEAMTPQERAYLAGAGLEPDRLSISSQLGVLERYLNDQRPAMTFDYIRLEHFCQRVAMRLLVRLHILDEKSSDLANGDFSGIVPVTYVGVVHEALEEATKMTTKQPGPAGPANVERGNIKAGSKLEICANILAECLEEDRLAGGKGSLWGGYAA